MQNVLSIIFNVILIVLGTCIMMIFAFWGITSFDDILDNTAYVYDYLGATLLILVIIYALYGPLKKLIEDTFY